MYSLLPCCNRDNESRNFQDIKTDRKQKQIQNEIVDSFVSSMPSRIHAKFDSWLESPHIFISDILFKMS